MGQYYPGDVLLVPVDLGSARGNKIRPALVVRIDGPQHLITCPISGHPPRDGKCISLDLEDFVEGGLDLFSESYILVSSTCRVRSSWVIGKKGRVSREYLDTIIRSCGIG